MCVPQTSYVPALMKPGARVVIKQYGERRTGTNYLKSLLEENFHHVLVLMHVLGDKHSAPVELSRDFPASNANAYERVRILTAKSHATGFWRSNASQRAYMRSIASEAIDAVQNGELRYLISIKDPYAWGASVAAYDHYLPRGLPRAKPIPDIIPQAGVALFRRVNDAWACFRLRQACLRFNERYRAWFGLCERFEDRCHVVRHEDLLNDPRAVLYEVAKRFQIRGQSPQFHDCPYGIRWTAWDDTRPTLDTSIFDAGYYRELRYMDSLTPGMHEIISTTIDWELVRPLGYAAR